MSEMNRALSKMAGREPQSNITLKKAEIPQLKSSRGKWIGLLSVAVMGAGFAAWGLGYVGLSDAPELPAEMREPILVKPQSEPVLTEATKEEKIPPAESAPSASEPSHTAVKPDTASVEAESHSVEAVTEDKAPPAVAKKTEHEKPLAERKSKPEAKPVAVAKAAPARASQPLEKAPQPKLTKTVKPEASPKASQKRAVSAESQQAEVVPVEKAPPAIQVQQVALTPAEVAERAIERASRALEHNDLATAITEYERALKYRANDDESRKKLAALYYGKQDVRSSVEVLRRGIRLHEQSQDLRMALSKILIREEQPEAALSPLVYLPTSPGTDYLALRAALAQQIKNGDIALESYQLLVAREGDNARWWLGQAIEQERKQLYAQAQASYRQALGRIGISKKTQNFIRERLSLLESMGDK